MGRVSDISNSVKLRMLNLYRHGKNQCYIANYLQCSQSSVSKILTQYLKDGQFRNKRSNGGRKPKTSARDDRKLKRIVKNNRFKSVRFLQRKWKGVGVQVSKSTTLRRLHKFKFESRVSKTKPLITAKQKRTRLNWCKSRVLWSEEDWNNVLFSDESMFCVSHGNQGVRVWRMKQEAYNKECLKRSVKLYGLVSVMVWGCMSGEGPGKLCIVYEKVNSQIYQDILEYYMISSSEDLIEDDFIFQHDLASPHTSVSTKSWLNQRNIKVLSWPANSPDINPIESLWGIMKKKLQENAPANKTELVARIKSVWANIDKNVCKQLVNSMQDRLYAVINGDISVFNVKYCNILHKYKCYSQLF